MYQRLLAGSGQLAQLVAQRNKVVAPSHMHTGEYPLADNSLAFAMTNDTPLETSGGLHTIWNSMELDIWAQFNHQLGVRKMPISGLT
jgi:hypothetical protein